MGWTIYRRDWKALNAETWAPWFRIWVLERAVFGHSARVSLPNLQLNDLMGIRVAQAPSDPQ